MERRFAVPYEELMAEADVEPEALEAVLERLKDFVQPFAGSLTQSHLQRDRAAHAPKKVYTQPQTKLLKNFCNLRSAVGPSSHAIAFLSLLERDQCR